MEVESSSDEEPNSSEVSRQPRPRRRRPTYKTKKPGGMSVSSCMSGDRGLTSDGFNQELHSDISSRDLSPTEQFREYISDCAGDMVDEFEQMYQEMSTKMSCLAESASAKSNALVQGSRHIVQRTAAGGAEMARKSSDMAKTAVAAAEKTAKSAAEVPGKVLDKVKEWKVHRFEKLPNWMRDNEFLTFGHRPELNSFTECFKSIFRIHTETGNIWTHLIGFVAFITLTIVFYVKPMCEYCNVDIDVREKLIFLFFFISAILCLGLSSLFHTVCCHSESVSNLFSKLDYAGIALLTVGSFVPWIYYGFYCQFTPKVIYLTSISVLGTGAIIVTMLDRFNKAEYRPLRAGLFVCLGGFGFVPTLHLFIQSGWNDALVKGGIPTLMVMAFLYIFGAVLYGCRIPERFLPGKFDLWFQSHQIFHVLVIAAAFVHYHGMTNMAVHRLTKEGECESAVVTVVFE